MVLPGVGVPVKAVPPVRVGGDAAEAWTVAGILPGVPLGTGISATREGRYP